MDTTDGLVRGMEVRDTGKPIQMPVGKSVLGRILTVVGEPVDEKGSIKFDKTYSIHRPAPKFTEKRWSPANLVLPMPPNTYNALFMASLRPI